ncbi:TPA: diguanylate phosphodiesterase, partial [Klebsiella variicola]|nr:diguanylate phosphodiesterase [Klebsiella variicola]
MLTTIIYRSHICDNVSFKSIEAMVARANERNGQADVTGILLFNGTHFFQLIEGPEEKVRDIYQKIVLDPRHYNLVELFCDYAPSRRFGKVGMELFDLREHDREEVLQTVMDRGTTKYQLTYDDRALQFFRTFVESTEKANYFEIPSADSWVFIPDKDTFYPDTPIIDNTESWSFAFQPIVDPFACEIISWEALLRTPDGQSPGAYFAGLAGDDIYLADLHSKRVALSLAGKLGLRNKALSINLLPMTLVKAPNAVAFLLDEISRNDLIPEQIIVEFTEREVISRMADFTDAVRKLKGAGINLAIDH